MIFVTLGTQDKSFERLLKEIDKLCKKKIIKDKVIVQAGITKYCSKYMKIYDFITQDEFDDYVKTCDILITHGGVGSILNGIKNNKKVIAVPRLYEYKEHVNNHQMQIIDEFNKKGLIVGLKGVDELENAIKNIKKFKTNEFISNNNKFIKRLEDYISEL